MTNRNSEGDRFARALDEASAADRRQDERIAGAALNQTFRVAFDLGLERPLGADELWDQAMGWTLPTEPHLPAPQASSPEVERLATAEGVADELDLNERLTAGELTRRWRDFVWRNHPDRQPRENRTQATARVAIANALYDRARARGWGR